MTDKPHNSLFKKFIAVPEVARQILQACLSPECFAQIDWSTLEAQKIAGIDPQLSERREDFLYRSHLAAHRDIFFYFHFEHQTNSCRLMPYRLAKEIFLIWEEHIAEVEAGGEFPLVVPVVVYAGTPKWKYPRRLRELITIPPSFGSWARDFVLDGGMIFIDLARQGADQCATGALGRALLQALTQAQRGEMNSDQVQEILTQMLGEKDAALIGRLIEYLWVYLLRNSALKKEEVRTIVENVTGKFHPQTPASTKGKLMSTAEMLIQEGREEGLTQGEWIGKIQLLEQLMGVAQTARPALEKKTVKQLSAQFSKLEAAYHREHRK